MFNTTLMKILSVEVGVSSNKGTPFMKLSLKDIDDRRIKHTLWLSEKALPWSMDSLNAYGYDFDIKVSDSQDVAYSKGPESVFPHFPQGGVGCSYEEKEFTKEDTQEIICWKEVKYLDIPKKPKPIEEGSFDLIDKVVSEEAPKTERQEPVNHADNITTSTEPDFDTSEDIPF